MSLMAYEMVQFHQSYADEDFMQGYCPTEKRVLSF